MRRNIPLRCTMTAHAPRVGDVPHHPVRLFALIVENNPPALILLRSFLLDLLDIAERVLPVLVPATVIDTAPAMRANR